MAVEYCLESTISGDEHRAYLEHIAEKYLERALEEYDACKDTAEQQRVFIAMVNSLADRFQMIESRAKR